MSEKIPADVLETARKVHLDILGKGIQYTTEAIARAIMDERERDKKIQQALTSAINFAIQCGDIDFLQAWTEGDFATVKAEYPEFDMTLTVASGATS